MSPLVAQLADRLTPVHPGLVLSRVVAGLGTGFAAALALTAVLLGFRPDLASAARGGAFWLKLGYTGLTALAAGGLVARLMRPAGRPGAAGLWSASPWGAMLVLGLVELARAPPTTQGALMLGGSASVCPWWIALLSLPPLAGLAWAARALAPVRLRLAGLAVGTAAGATGASAYAFHCTEGAAPFLAIWYPVGVAIAALTGLIVGPRLLRW